MKSKWLSAHFLKRYKRFFTDVDLNGKIETAHLPNTGSLKGCLESGAECLISPSENPERKLKFTFEAISVQGHWVGVNTSWPNKLALEVFKDQRLTHWSGFDRIQSEVKINTESRIDLCLWSTKDLPIEKLKFSDIKAYSKIHFVEIKNVTLKEGMAAQFPDAATERGQKHIEEMKALMKRGFSAEMLYVVQRTDVSHFETALDIDPDYHRLLKEAMAEGLKVTALTFEVSPSGIKFHREIPIKIKD